MRCGTLSNTAPPVTAEDFKISIKLHLKVGSFDLSILDHVFCFAACFKFSLLFPEVSV